MKIKNFLSFVSYVVERFAVKYQSNDSSSKQASLGRETINIKKYLYFYFFGYAVVVVVVVLLSYSRKARKKPNTLKKGHDMILYPHTRTDIGQGFQSLVSRLSLYSHAAPPLFLPSFLTSALSFFKEKHGRGGEKDKRGTRPAAGSSHTFIKHSFSPNHHQPSLPPSLLHPSLPILFHLALLAVSPAFFIHCTLLFRSLSLPCLLSFFFVVGHCSRNAPLSFRGCCW